MRKFEGIWSSLVVCALLHGTTAFGGNVIQDVAVSKQGADVVVKVQLRDPVAEVPKGFSVSNPPRLAFDFLETSNGGVSALQNVKQGDLTSLNLVPAADRVRLVLNLVQNMNYEASLQGNAVIFTLKAMPAASVAGAQRFNTPQASSGSQAVRDITFRRGKDGEGRIIVDFAESGAPADVRQQGGSIIVDLPRSSLPDHLSRKLDVTDFATPVVSVLPQSLQEGVRLTITPKGLWEHNAYQTDQQLIVEVKPVIEDPNKLVQGTRLGYQGPLVSINYANGDVRALLRLMAEELGLDAVISETVAGSITLVLKDVPADQVMDIIFRQKGLDMRKSGKVILIAPREELSLRDKLEYEAKQQINDLEPLVLEVFQLSYQKAVDLAKLLGGQGGASSAGATRMLTKRGSVTADSLTNTLFVNDIPSKLDEIRRFVKTIDVGRRQVLIEARVVEANDGFNKDLGVRMNLLNTRYNNRIGNYNVAGGLYATPTGTLSPSGIGTETATQTQNKTAGVNLPSFASEGGTLSFALFNSSLTRILNLELAALETDGRGKLISSPKVVTANNTEALIEDGTEIPYVIPAAGNNNATVAFKKAKLSLRTTPQITPEGKVRMKLNIAKEEPDWSRQIGGIPPIKSSIVETDVVVENGGTVVVGGVFTVSNEKSTERVPFLGDLPYIGFLFKVQNTSMSRRELLVFITPRVINEQMELK